MFYKEMSKIEQFLRSNSNHIINQKNYTNNEILEIFLYGKISHTSQKEAHDRLKNTPLYSSFKNIFIMILFNYLILIRNLIYTKK